MLAPSRILSQGSVGILCKAYCRARASRRNLHHTVLHHLVYILFIRAAEMSKGAWVGICAHFMADVAKLAPDLLFLLARMVSHCF